MPVAFPIHSPDSCKLVYKAVYEDAPVITHAIRTDCCCDVSLNGHHIAKDHIISTIPGILVGDADTAKAVRMCEEILGESLLEFFKSQSECLPNASVC